MVAIDRREAASPTPPPSSIACARAGSIRRAAALVRGAFACALPPPANRPSGPSPACRPRATLGGTDRTPARAPPIGQKRASPGSARSSQDGSRDASDGSAGCWCCPARGQGVRRTRRADGRGVPARGGPALLGMQRPRQRARSAPAPGGEALGRRRDGAALHGLPRRPAHAATSVSVPALPTGTAPAVIGPAGAAVQRPSPS